VGKGTKLDNVRTASGQLLGEEEANASPSEKALQPVRVTMQGGKLPPVAWRQLVLPLLENLLRILRGPEQKTPTLFCMGLVPPGGLSACRHLSKLLRRRLPALNIVVGHWGLHEKIHNDRETLLAAGATLVAATLVETCDLIAQTLHPHVKLQPDPSGAHGTQSGVNASEGL
jgi:hypothetical protein